MNQPSQWPDISDDFNRYVALVPEFELPPEVGARMGMRAEEVLKALIHNSKGELLGEKDIVRNIKTFQTGIRAKVQQLEGNAAWLSHLHPVREKIQPRGGDTVWLNPLHSGGEWFRDIPMASSDAEFLAAPRTDLKVFQEILSDSCERMAIGRKEKLVTAHDIVISPSRITETLLRNLGLSEFIPKKGTAAEKDQRMTQDEKLARRAEAIPAIKDMLDSLEPLNLPHEQDPSEMRYFRLFRVHKGKNRGKILGTQMVNGEKVMFLAGLHSADRRIGHIHTNYAKEVETLAEINDTIGDVEGRISKDWKRTKQPENLAEVKKKLLGLVDQLKFVTDENKVKMRGQIDAAVTMETVYTLPKKRIREKGRMVIRPEKTIVALNPGATLARINTSHLHVGNRLAKMGEIEGFLSKDSVRLKTFVAAQTKALANFYTTVRQREHELKIYKLNRPMSKDEREKAIGNLESLKRTCDPETTPIMLFEPYLSFATEAVKRLDGAIAALKKLEDGESRPARIEAVTEFTKVYLVAKIQKFYVGIQQLYAKFLSDGKVLTSGELDALIDELKTLDDELVTVDVDPQTPTKDFNPVIGDLYRLIHGVRKDANNVKTELTRENDKAVSMAMGLLHDRIKYFDFAATMKKVVVPEAQAHRPSKESSS